MSSHPKIAFGKSFGFICPDNEFAFISELYPHYLMLYQHYFFVGYEHQFTETGNDCKRTVTLFTVI